MIVFVELSEHQHLNVSSLIQIIDSYKCQGESRGTTYAKFDADSYDLVDHQFVKLKVKMQDHAVTLMTPRSVVSAILEGDDDVTRIGFQSMK